MPRKKKSKIAKARVSDEELIRRLEDEAPEVLRASILEEAFHVAVEGLVKEAPSKKSPVKSRSHNQK
jgi:hypothetical protein